MRIGLIAISGVRVMDPELLEVGLTLPGFVERSKVIASLPSLSLLTLAALTPSDIDIDYREVPDEISEGALPQDYDLVAISSCTGQIRDAYRVAERYTSRGVPVVMGGLHVTALPDEARAHGAIPAVGEGELVWPAIVQDLLSGSLRSEYRPPPGVQFDLGQAPIPRFEILDVERYNRLTVQTSRGCPHRCEFCASSVLLAPHYRVKPVEKIIAEIRRIKELWPKPFIEFADDNSFINREHSRTLLRALCDEKVHWFTEADISIARDPELIDLMGQSGCRQVLIGLESPVLEGLAGLEMRSDWKRLRFPEYETAIRAIQSRGITVNGCFVLGLDGHTEDIFDAVLEFADRTGLYEVQITVMTPFPGTPLHARLRNEGRLLDEDWDKRTLFDVCYVPTGMTPDRLRRGLIDLARRLYDDAFVAKRRRRFHQLRRRGTGMPESRKGGK